MTHTTRRSNAPLNLVGMLILAVAMACLLASYFVGGDILTAFLLGAFSAGLVGAVTAFGFAKVSGSIHELRTHVDALSAQVEEMGGRES